MPKSFIVLFFILFSLYSCSHAPLASRQIANQDPTCVEIVNNFIRTKVNNKFLANKKFETLRDFRGYSNYFPFPETGSFKDTVLNLPSDSLWMDMGSGDGIALAQGLEKNLKINGVAVSYNKMLMRFEEKIYDGNYLIERKFDGRVRQLEGDYVENFAKDGKLNEWMGKASLITDLFGPISYSEDLVPIFQTYFDLLSPNGILEFNFMLEKNFNSDLQLLPNRVSMNSVDGNKRGLLDWLKTIPGITIIEVVDQEASSNEFVEKSISVKIKKIKDKIKVPNTLQSQGYEEGAPPLRIFKLMNKNQASLTSDAMDFVKASITAAKQGTLASSIA